MTDHTRQTLADQTLVTYLREMDKNPANETVCFLAQAADRLDTLMNENRRLASLLYSHNEAGAAIITSAWQ